MNHHATPEFWSCYRSLPEEVRGLADRSIEFLNADPRHPSVRLKQIGDYWSARIGLHYRALGITVDDGISWFWMGHHSEYDKLIG